MPQKIFDILPPTAPNNLQKGEKESLFEREFLPLAPEKEKKKKGNLKKIIGAICAVLILTILFLHFVTYKAEILIWPETQTSDFDEKVNIEPKASQVDLVVKNIPGETLEQEKEISGDFPASGKTEKKAKGKIRVFNNSNKTVRLIVGTRFRPPSQELLYFCSLKSLSIPAKSYIDAEFEACYPGTGEKYNLGPSKFSVPGLAGTELFYYVYGESFTAMTGGGESLRVTQEDLDRAKNILAERLLTESKTSFKNLIPVKDLILLDEGISQEIIDSSSLTKVGSEMAKFNFKVKSKLKAILFKKSNLEEFAEEFILASLRNKEEGDEKIPVTLKILKDSLKINWQVESLDQKSGKIVLDLKFSAKVYYQTDENFLKSVLSGKSLDEAQIILENQPKIIKSEINFWPFWIKRIPENPERIKIKFKLD